MSFLYQSHQQYFAQVAGGLEEAAIQELRGLGATGLQAKYRGVSFKATSEVLYRVNYQTRLCTRILAPLIAFDCHSDKYLYRRIGEVDWSAFMDVDHTFAVFANVSHSTITHSKYAALVVKDAIVDQFRDRTGQRPSIDRRTPDVWLNLYITNNHATLSFDTSGGSLHRRGYRQASVEAPMQETVAAAMLHYAEWDGGTPLIDPFCGSGTILCEALMRATHTPAGALRERFGFQRMPDFQSKTWARVQQAAKQQQQPPPHPISGSDMDSGAVRAAHTNLAVLPHGDTVSVRRADFRQLPALEGVTLMCNPPYGLRIGRGDGIEHLYREFGDFLKQKCTGSTAYIYAGKRELLKHVGLRAAWKKPLVNGALDGRVAKYELY
ncbi:MAG: THUMP domain-containing protein [Rhodothermales bacterium]